MSFYLYCFSQSWCFLILVLWPEQYIVSFNGFAPKDSLSLNIYQSDFRNHVAFCFGTSLGDACVPDKLYSAAQYHSIGILS